MPKSFSDIVKSTNKSMPNGARLRVENSIKSLN